MWVEEYLGNGSKRREDFWTDSIPVGRKSYVERVKSLPGFKAKGRNETPGEEGHHLRRKQAFMRPFPGPNTEK